MSKALLFKWWLVYIIVCDYLNVRDVKEVDTKGLRERNIPRLVIILWYILYIRDTTYWMEFNYNYNNFIVSRHFISIVASLRQHVSLPARVFLFQIQQWLSRNKEKEKRNLISNWVTHTKQRLSYLHTNVSFSCPLLPFLQIGLSIINI